MLNLTVEKATIWLLLPLLFCARDTATYTRQQQQQQQQWQQQEPHDQQRLLSVNEKQVQTIVNYMNTSADPCNDIFTYACGNWPSYHTTPRYMEVIGLLDHKMNKKFAQLLEDHTSRNESQRSELDEAIFQKLWTYYKSCRHQKFLQIHRFLQLVRPAGHVNWPILDGSTTWPDGKRISWWLTLAKLRRYGMKGALIRHEVIPKMANGEFMISLDRADANLLLPPTAEVLKVFLILGLSPEKAARQYLRILRLEQMVHKLVIASIFEDDSKFREVSVLELSAKLPQVPWRKYLKVVLDGADIGDNFTMQISNSGYFVQLAKLLERTDPVVTFNYLMVMFLAHLEVESASAFEKIQCVMEVRSKMDMAANYIYWKRLYGAEAAVYQSETSALLERLRLQMEKLIDQNRLAFEPDEVASLKQKLNAMRLSLGNLPLVESGSQDQSLAEIVDDYYKDLSLNPRNYYQNQLALLELRFRKEHQQALRPPTSSNYLFVADSDSARSSSPYFIMHHNHIFVPAGNFLTPMFHRNMHDLLKISLFGFVLGHELAHGFDVSNILIDHQGNMHDLGLKMRENPNFSQGVECLQRDVTESINERVADVVGVRLAYEAYFGQPNVDVSARLPFTDFSARRLFFLNMAQFFCGIRSTFNLDHDSDGVRLQQTLSNFEPFAEEYGCRTSDAMNPAEKCRLY